MIMWGGEAKRKWEEEQKEKVRVEKRQAEIQIIGELCVE